MKTAKNQRPSSANKNTNKKQKKQSGISAPPAMTPKTNHQMANNQTSGSAGSYVTPLKGQAPASSTQRKKKQNIADNANKDAIFFDQSPYNSNNAPHNDLFAPSDDTKIIGDRLQTMQGKTFEVDNDQSNVNLLNQRTTQEVTDQNTQEEEAVYEQEIEEEDESDQRLTVNIEIGTGNFQTIVVRQWDDPVLVAAKFCQQMALDTELQRVLTDQLTQNMRAHFNGQTPSRAINGKDHSGYPQDTVFTQGFPNDNVLIEQDNEDSINTPSKSQHSSHLQADDFCEVAPSPDDVHQNSLLPPQSLPHDRSQTSANYAHQHMPTFSADPGQLQINPQPNSVDGPPQNHNHNQHSYATYDHNLHQGNQGHNSLQHDIFGGNLYNGAFSSSNNSQFQNYHHRTQGSPVGLKQQLHDRLYNHAAQIQIKHNNSRQAYYKQFDNPKYCSKKGIKECIAVGKKQWEHHAQRQASKESKIEENRNFLKSQEMKECSFEPFLNHLKSQKTDPNVPKKKKLRFINTASLKSTGLEREDQMIQKYLQFKKLNKQMNEENKKNEGFEFSYTPKVCQKSARMSRSVDRFNKCMYKPNCNWVKGMRSSKSHEKYPDECNAFASTMNMSQVIDAHRSSMYVSKHSRSQRLYEESLERNERRKNIYTQVLPENCNFIPQLNKNFKSVEPKYLSPQRTFKPQLPEGATFTPVLNDKKNKLLLGDKKLKESYLLDRSVRVVSSENGTIRHNKSKLNLSTSEKEELEVKHKPIISSESKKLYEKALTQNLQQIFLSLDKDNDGKIKWTEFEYMWLPPKIKDSLDSTLTKFMAELPSDHEGIDKDRFVDIGRKLFHSKMTPEQKSLIMTFTRPKRESISHEMQHCKFQPNSNDPNRQVRRKSVDMYARQMERLQEREAWLKQKVAEKEFGEMSIMKSRPDITPMPLTNTSFSLSGDFSKFLAGGNSQSGLKSMRSGQSFRGLPVPSQLLNGSIMEESSISSNNDIEPMTPELNNKAKANINGAKTDYKTKNMKFIKTKIKTDKKGPKPPKIDPIIEDWTPKPEKPIKQKSALVYRKDENRGSDQLLSANAKSLSGNNGPLSLITDNYQDDHPFEMPKNQKMTVIEKQELCFTID